MVSTKLVALWPSWVTENHFSPFQINTQLLFIFEFFTQLLNFFHFGLPKITFGCISLHFRSIRNFFFKVFMKRPLAAMLDDGKSLSIAFLSISDQYATFCFEFFFTKWLPAAILEVRFGPFWMTENHFRSHFSPFQINTQLFLF